MLRTHRCPIGLVQLISPIFVPFSEDRDFLRGGTISIHFLCIRIYVFLYSCIFCPNIRKPRKIYSNLDFEVGNYVFYCEKCHKETYLFHPLHICHWMTYLQLTPFSFLLGPCLNILKLIRHYPLLSPHKAPQKIMIEGERNNLRNIDRWQDKGTFFFDLIPGGLDRISIPMNVYTTVSLWQSHWSLIIFD